MQTMHRVVMSVDTELTDEEIEKVVFVPNDDEGSDMYEQMSLDWDVWCRMHKPHEITVTVEPGNKMEEPELSDVQDNIGGTPVNE